MAASPTTRPQAFEGTDSFFYASSNVGGGDTAEVVFTVADLVWFIDIGASGTSDGTLANPFTSVASFNTVNNNTGTNPGNGDGIFLASGSYSPSPNLLTSQTLVGQGTDGTFASAFGITEPPFTPTLPTLGGSDPTISGGLALIFDNTVSGLTVGSDITGANVGTSAVREVTAPRFDMTASSGSSDVDIADSTFNGASTLGLIDVDVTGTAALRIDITDSTVDSTATT